MAPLKFRLAALTVNVLQFAVTLFLFATVQVAGSAYLMAWRGLDAGLPELTLHVALPLLRIAPPDPHERPITLWWVWLVWGALLAAPLVTSYATWKAATLEEAGQRFSVGSWLWVTLLAALVALVVIGCVLPFQCL